MSTKKQAIINGISLIIFQAFFSVIVSFFYSEVALKSWEIMLLLEMIIIGFYSISKYGFFSEITIFYASFLIFLASYPIQDLFGIIDFRNLKLLSYSTYLTFDTAIQTIQCLVVSLSTLWLVINFFNFKEIDLDLSSKSIKFEKNIFMFFCVLLVLSIPYKFYLAYLVRYFGYNSIFGAMSVTGGIYVSKLCGGLILPFFIACAIIGVSKNRMKKMIMWYLFVSVLDIFTGRRATLFVVLLFIGWFYNRYIHTISFRKVFFIIISCILLSSTMIIVRNSTLGQYSSSGNSSILNDGDSVYVISLVIDNEDSLNSIKCNETGIPYFCGLLDKNIKSIYYKLSGKISPFSEGQTVDSLNNSTYLGWELTYLLKPQSFLSGYGMGTSYIAESYLSCKFVGVFLFTGLVLISIFYLQKANSMYGKALYFTAVNGLFEMPRSNFLNFIMEWFVVCIIITIARLIYVKRKNI